MCEVLKEEIPFISSFNTLNILSSDSLLEEVTQFLSSSQNILLEMENIKIYLRYTIERGNKERKRKYSFVFGYCFGSGCY